MFHSQTLREYLGCLILLSLLIGASFFLIFCNKIKKNDEMEEYDILKDSLVIEREGVNFNSKKPILLIFFSVDCPGCYEPILKVNFLYNKIYNKMEILGISRDDIRSIEHFRLKFRLKFPVIYDKLARYHKRFKVNIVPQRVVIKESRIIYKDDPYKNFPDREIEFNEVIERLL